ncbi:MAG: hypothetical protein HDR72_02315 [Ruminococcaceae bacterium]|nr:hypothetical protein [Oscillospiraceae bacterium]
MSIKRILAAASASVVAVSAMAVVASAAKVAVPANVENGWKDAEIFNSVASLEAMLDDGKKASDVDTITIKTDGYKMGIGFHAADADYTWKQATEIEDYYFEDSITLKSDEISLTEEKCYLKIFYEPGTADAGECEVTFTYKEAAPADTTPADTTPSETAPADTNTASNVDTGVESLAVVVGAAAVAAGAMIVAKKR